MSAAPSNPPNAAVAKAANAWGQAAVTNAKSSYDPRKFYCRATDAKGHGEKLGGRVPPEVYGALQELVQRDDFPDYTTPWKAVLDFIVHGIELRRKMIADPGLRDALDELIERLGHLEYVTREEQAHKERERIMELIHEHATRLHRDGAWILLREFLDSNEERADHAPDPYRGQMLAAIKAWRVRLPAEHQV